MTDGSNHLDDSTILQVDGGIIAGLLVFLTLTSLIPLVAGPFGNVIAILLTAGVIFPFAISAAMILSKYISSRYRSAGSVIAGVKNYSTFAKNATFWGFVYLMGVIVVLFALNLWSIFVPTPSTIAEVCKNNPEEFGMEPDTCLRIAPGSIYEECVKNNMPNVIQCSKFMID